MTEENSKKHKLNDENNEEDENFVGPTLSEATIQETKKKRKTLPHEHLYLKNLPNSESYEKSYMHRDIITHCLITSTDFLITASCDGHIKFWKKIEVGIEFVKHFRSHLGPIVSISSNVEGSLFASASSDKSLKIFDVINFDMINMMRFDYEPSLLEWIHGPGDAISTLAVTDANSGKIYVYDGRGTNIPLQILEKIHVKPVGLMKYNYKFDVTVSIDKIGMLGKTLSDCYL